MDPGELTPFGLKVEFLDDGRCLLRIGAMVVALSPRQTTELRHQLGVGTVTVTNDTPFALRWLLRSEPVYAPNSRLMAGKNYTLVISTGPHDRGDPRKPEPPALPSGEPLPSNVKRLRTPRKKKEKP